MIEMSVHTAVQALTAKLWSPQVDAESAAAIFTGVQIDSRKILPGNLFAALPGTQADGHDFVAAAAAKGAVVALVNHRVEADLLQIEVPDVQQALGRLAHLWLHQTEAKVIAITGSNGKTTVKEMVASILAEAYQVHATRGNHNNELGVPLTLFDLSQQDDFVVLEMGASKAGDIRYLTDIAQPDVAVITNVGPAHLEGFGDERGVALAKGEIYTALKTAGVAVLNAQQPWQEEWMGLLESKTALRFSVDPQIKAAVTSGSSADGKPLLVTPLGTESLQLQLPGQHNVENALAAATIAIALEIPLAAIVSGLAKVEPVQGRLNPIRSAAGWQVIDDTYNANPASLYAALQVLSEQADEAWLILGDMKELGPAAIKLHAEMGDAARSFGVTRLFTLGEVSRQTSESFGPGGEHFTDRNELIEAVLGQLHERVTCLIKGSRSMAMEQVVAALHAGVEATIEKNNKTAQAGEAG